MYLKSILGLMGEIEDVGDPGLSFEGMIEKRASVLGLGVLV